MSSTAPMGGVGMMVGTTGGGGSFRGLIAQKEKELHDINEYRIHTLETLLQEKEREQVMARCIFPFLVFCGGLLLLTNESPLSAVC